MPSPNQLLLEALEKRWKTYRAELKRCRAEFSNEAVHDMRVALRRLLSLIRLLNSISPRPRLRKLSRAIKDKLNGFDDLRDTQVMLVEISEMIKELPQLKQFQGYLEHIEETELKDLRKELKNSDLTDVARRIRKTRESLTGKEEIDSAAVILQSVDDAFLVTKQRYERIDRLQPASIHRVRIAFKNFRYMFEIVHPLLDGFPLEQLKIMHDYQSLMGEIQDAEVFLQTLADFQPTASSFDFELVRRHYESRRADAISAYLKNKDMLNIFWRPSPEGAFPWEKTK
jgi:CHAD domain-containing protein